MVHLRSIAMAWVFVLVPTLAQAAETSATAFLRSKQAKVSALMKKSGSSSARDSKLQGLIDGLLDYDELAKRALDEEWDRRKAKGRERFVALLRQLVERNYRDNVRNTLDYAISYNAEVKQGEAAVVKTVAKSTKNRRSPPITIDYSMHRVGKQWSIFDVRTDGVSLVENYRNQFRRIIRKDGWDGLMQRMEKRVAAQKSAD